MFAPIFHGEYTSSDRKASGGLREPGWRDERSKGLQAWRGADVERWSYCDQLRQTMELRDWRRTVTANG
ncbi:UNVERIFIED_CONTAM: hypothetical protein Sradi_6212000 [Sesamum radiatum]|uniref:Uncharacterized protein n=1 Tax=Sesamum radiatum TaxID=300843 RepID=A0AAW2K9S8_SESRA